MLEPWYEARPVGAEIPVIVTTTNLYDPDNGIMYARDLSRIDINELGFRFLALLYLEYAKKRF